MKKTESISHVDVAESIELKTLNYTDIIKNNNKVYSVEIVKDLTGRFWLRSSYGRVGGTLQNDWRSCIDQYDAEKELNKIVKSKLKKGYVEIDLIKSNIASEEGNKKVKQSSISVEQAKKLGIKTKEESNLSQPVQRLMGILFDSMQDFINVTLDASCPIGQLSIAQIEKGRDILAEVKNIVSSKKIDIQELNRLTNQYYSNIPFSFKYQRLDADKLRLDSTDKIDAQILTLETLENVKSSETALLISGIDDKYNSLNTEIELLDSSREEFKWVETLFLKTKANNHYNFNRMKIKNVFVLKRPKEEKIFLEYAEEIAKQSGKRKELPYLLQPLWEKRFISNNEFDKLMEKANILPLFHGSNTANYGSILKSTIRLPRSAGCITSGAMYSKFGCYFGFASKSAQYSSMGGSFYGSKTNKPPFLLLNHVICGSQKVATGPYPYTAEIIKPNHTVWAKGSSTGGGYSSGVLNDEFITFSERNHLLKYLIEFGE